MSKKISSKRDRNPDFDKIAAFLTYLKQFPDGIWLRRISNDLKLSTSTVSRYVDSTLREFVESVGYKDDNDRYIGVRIIKLKEPMQNRRFTVNEVKSLLEKQKFIRNIG